MLQFFILGLLFFLTYHLYWKRRSLPPGPTPLPFIGNALHFWYYGLDAAIFKFHKTYGDLHTLWFGDTPVVSLNDYPTIIEKFLKNGEAVAGREESTLLMEMSRSGAYGIIGIDGALWSSQRKFALKVLRDLGMGKDIMQEKVLTEASAILEELKENLEKGQCVVSLQDLIDRAVGSVINSIVLGYRFDKTNTDKFHAAKRHAIDFVNVMGHPLWKIMEKGPVFLRHLPLFKAVHQKMKVATDGFRDFIEPQIQQHRESFNLEKPYGQPRDFVEAFLMEQKRLEKEGVKGHEFTDEQLYAAASDLWGAGQETTSTALAWVFHYLTRYQKVQAKVHKELNSVIGSDRLITMNDKPTLPYLNAVIQEVFRHCRFFPINLVHRALEDIDVHGYKIPKNTTIVDNFVTVLRDERYFENPELFDPERFIDENGKFIPKPEVMVFGVGKRACVGEGLARMELFLFTANILNQMKLSEDVKNPLTEKSILGATNVPVAFVVKVESRF